MRRAVVLVMVSLWSLVDPILAGDTPVVAKIKPARETTYFLGPLDAFGEIDYETALNERLRGKITPEQNANVLLVQALGPAPEGGAGMPPEFFRWLGIPMPPAKGDYFVPLHRYLSQQLKLSKAEQIVIHEQQIKATASPWKVAQYPHIAAWLKANEKPLALVITASRREQYFNPLVPPRLDESPQCLIESLLSNVQSTRDVARALAARSMLRVDEGKFDEAWSDLLAAHRLSRLMGKGSSIIEMLVSVALERMIADADASYIERANLTSEQCLQRIADLQSLAPRAPVANRIDLMERVAFLDSMRFIRRGRFGILKELGDTNARDLTSQEKEVVGQLDWAWIQREGNRWFDRFVAAQRIPDRKLRKQAIKELEMELAARKEKFSHKASLTSILLREPQLSKVNEEVIVSLMALFLPGLNSSWVAFDQVEQSSRNVLLAFALAAYHRDARHYPGSLNELAPKYLTTVPLDVFSGKSLVYRLTPGGYEFYSVGRNEQDDKGHGYDDKPAADDLGIRMPKK